MTQLEHARPRGGMVTIAALGARALVQFILLLLLSRSGGVDSATDYILITAMIAPVQPIAELGLRLQLVLRPHGLALRPVLELRLVGYACLVLGVGCVALQVGISPLVIVGVLLGKCADGMGDIAAGHLQRSRGLSVPSRVTLATSAASLAALATASSFGWPPGLLPLAAALTAACGAIAMWGVVAHDMRRRLHSGAIVPRAELVWAGVKMGFGGSLAGLAASLPQFALGWNREDMGLAAFAYLAYCLTAADLMVNGLSQARLGQVADTNATGNWESVSKLALRNSLSLMARVSVPGLAGLLVTAPLIERVAGIGTYIGPLDLALMFVAILSLPFPYMYASALIAMDATGQVLIAAAAGSVLVAVICVSIVPAMGLTGAALAVALGGITRSAVAVLLLKAKVRSRTRNAQAPA